MKIGGSLYVAVTVGAMLAGGPAFAAKQCDIVGTYTDTLGSTIVFKTAKSGTAQNSLICGSVYKLKVTKDTSKAINAKGKAAGCGNLIAKFVPDYPTCNTATGTVTIAGVGQFDDTITKQGDAVKTRAKPDTSSLTNGLR